MVDRSPSVRSTMIVSLRRPDTVVEPSSVSGSPPSRESDPTTR